jgi:NAD(P)-dependent dehydrogenase (short-subunit alcohol dehydrogenase family)
MDLDLRSKVVVVTGASSGIGEATARRVGAEGACVVAVGRAKDKLDALVGELGAERATAVACDLTDATAPGRIVAEARRAFGRIDGLVNSAGILTSGGIDATDDARWDEMMAINVTSVFRMTRAVVDDLRATRGAVVNVSSVTGLRAFPGLVAYCVSKAAIDQLTRCVALDLAPHGVRVNAVNPGVVVTPLQRRGGMSAEAYAQFLDRAKTTHPIGRAGSSDEVADLIAFLLSARCGWVTGTTVSIDGGRALTCAR